MFSDLMGPEPGQRKGAVQPAQLGQQTSLWGLPFPLPAHHRGLAGARAGGEFLDLSLQPVASPKPGILGQAKVCLPCCEQLGAGQKAQAEQGAGIERILGKIAWGLCLGTQQRQWSYLSCSQGLVCKVWPCTRLVCPNLQWKMSRLGT